MHYQSINQSINAFISGNEAHMKQKHTHTHTHTHKPVKK